MQAINWRLAIPACVLAASLVTGACGRDDDGDGTAWAGKPNPDGAAAERDGDLTAGAGNVDVQDMNRTSNARDMQISLVGCLRRATPGSARYVLSDVRTAGVASDPGAVGTTGTATESTGGSSPAADRYELVARSGQDLGDHVGRRVKVTGRLATQTAYADQANRDQAFGTTGSDTQATRGNASDAAWQTLHVKDVQRFGSETCSSTSPGR